MATRPICQERLSGESLFGWIRRTLSVKGFVEVELPGTELVPYGNGKFYGQCQLPGHKETNGTSFLLDEVFPASDRATPSVTDSKNLRKTAEPLLLATPKTPAANSNFLDL